ncbi:MAG: nucleoside 2-deoxyribosyltransferase [Ignavibacteria bacterium]|nr:nucleoside 2-deoxyribosyltransferase [Ignavibacteria bacterium]
MNRKIYCAGAIRGDNSFQKSFLMVIDLVAECGFQPLTELKLDKKNNLTDREIYERDIEWLKQSDAVIAEISGPSLGVGFEIAYALYVLQKPVLALYSQNVKNVSAMIKGCNSELLSLVQYKDENELSRTVREFLYILEKFSN